MPAAAAGIWRAGQVGMCRHQGYERGNMTGSKVTSLPPSPPISHFLGQPPPSTSLADSFHDSAGQEAEEGASGTKLTLPLFPRR